MKILVTNDIHVMPSIWKELVKECQDEQYDIVAIAGDLLPKNNGILRQLEFMPNIRKYVDKIRDTGAEIVLTLGNDDNQLLIPEFIKMDDEGLIHYAENKVVEVKGIEFAGMPYVPDYPFGYKYWCHAEFRDKPRVDPQQFGKPCLVDDDNTFKNINDLEGYLLSKKTIWEILTELAPWVKNMSKCIWLIHAPPSGMNLDVCAHGQRVGSDAVRLFIEEYCPWITVHGHIHESPEYNGGKWKDTCGNTTCIQGGQAGNGLCYSVIEIDGDDVKIRNSHYS